MKKNVVDCAKDYLSIFPSSKQGLIDLLIFKGYTKKEAVFATKHCGINDWSKQVIKCAWGYLECHSLSEEELIEQLEFEGFTHEEALYGIEICKKINSDSFS